MQQILILVPLLNANEPEARLVEVHVKDGHQVKQGDVLFTLETTKAASDVESPGDGYFRLVAVENGTYTVGDTLAVLTSTPGEVLEYQPAQSSVQNSTEKSTSNSADAGPILRITNPARALAISKGIDLSSLPSDRLITEEYIRQLGKTTERRRSGISNNKILIFGAGGHAKAVMEMVNAQEKYEISGVIDDNPALTGTTVLGLPVIGTRDQLTELLDQGMSLAANGVGGIINIGLRIKIFELLAGQGFQFPVIQHPRASVELSAEIEEGVQVFANAYVGSSVILNKCCMINTGAIVSHDCVIGAYTHIAPGALLAGQVTVGEKTLVGMGVSTAIGITIGDGARIGNGAILLTDVPARAIVPAGKVWSAA